MPDAFDQNAQDVGLSLDTIEEEIEAGLRMHADRLVWAFDNEEFYAGRNAGYIARRESEDWINYIQRPKRTSKLLRKVVRTLAAVYSPGPTRQISDNRIADLFLQEVYKRNNINDLMMQVDRRTVLNGFTAIQAHATGRPEKPIQLYMWGAHEIVCWTWPDDPTEVWAVCTITRQKRFNGTVAEQRLRYDAWSRDEHRVYLSKWVMSPPPQQWVAQQYRGLFGRPANFFLTMSGDPAGSGKNPYGVLPFCFAHDEPPTSDFYEGGLGNALRECNAEIDRELSDLAQHTREFMDPDRFTTGVSAAWRREKKSGNWQSLSPDKAMLEGGGGEPKAFLVQARLAVEDVWHDSMMYANTFLEELGVPLVAIRGDASTDLSGIAIVAKHVPLLELTRAKQPRYTSVEIGLASLVLSVAGSAYGEANLIASSVDTDLTVTWPTPRFPMPTPERDLQDQWEMDHGIKSLVDVVAERGGFTTEQAMEQIERVAKDNAWLANVISGKEQDGKEEESDNVIEDVADDDNDSSVDDVKNGKTNGKLED